MNAGTEEGWALLRAGGASSSQIEVPTIATEVVTPQGPVRLALGNDGEARILLPLAKGADPRGIEGAQALSITQSRFGPPGKPYRFLDLVCLSKDLEPVFREVVNEMLSRIAAGESCVAAAEATIGDFRSLLARLRSQEIPVTSAAGLVAELIVLNRLLDRSSKAWRCWRGPRGDRHDYRRGDMSLEVKSSLTISQSTITINGINQLERPVGGSLHLIHFTLEPVTAGPLNISTLGTAALQKADDPDQLKQMINVMGCDDVESPAWNQHRFRLEAEALYEITDDFPRLTPSMLVGGVPPGVAEVNYRVDLSVAKSFICPTAIYEKIEGNLSTCH